MCDMSHLQSLGELDRDLNLSVLENVYRVKNSTTSEVLRPEETWTETKKVSSNLPIVMDTSQLTVYPQAPGIIDVPVLPSPSQSYLIPIDQDPVILFITRPPKSCR